MDYIFIEYRVYFIEMVVCDWTISGIRHSWPHEHLIFAPFCHVSSAVVGGEISGLLALILFWGEQLSNEEGFFQLMVLGFTVKDHRLIGSGFWWGQVLAVDDVMASQQAEEEPGCT